jgi:hypothetical protein
MNGRLLKVKKLSVSPLTSSPAVQPRSRRTGALLSTCSSQGAAAFCAHYGLVFSSDMLSFLGTDVHVTMRTILGLLG